MENPSSSSSSAAAAAAPAVAAAATAAEHDDHERRLCFENEPKALFDKEMKLAREAALEVINNNSEEQALKIFLQGLEPITTSVRSIWDEVLVSESNVSDTNVSDTDDVLVSGSSSYCTIRKT